MCKKLLLLIVLIVGISSNVYAQIDTVAVNKALDQLYNGDYESAYPVLKELADQGHKLGLFVMGSYCQNGLIGEKDLAKAFNYYWKSATLGLAEAQMATGDMFLYGEGVTQDSSKAASWYTKAAEQGFVEAKYNLGLMYYMGGGIEQDDAQALKWLSDLAENGDVNSQYMVGDIYLSQTSLLQDHETGLKWMKKAADQGLAQAQFKMGMVKFGGYDVPSDHARALMWFFLASEQGHEEAQVMMESMAEMLTAEEKNEAAERVKFWKMKHKK